MSQYLDNVYKFILFMFALAFLYDPESLGGWKAQMDIGYDMIWSSSDSYALSEYLVDYTCGEEN